MHDIINTEVDLEFEYNGEVLKFQMVPVSGTIDWESATEWETAWSEVDIQIDMTPLEVQDCVVEMFTHPPSWAFTDGQDILDELNLLVETKAYSLGRCG